MQPVIDYYDQLASEYDRDRFANSYGRYIDAQERAILRHWLNGADKTRTVDFGCGTGRLLEFATTGVDGSSEMLHIAAQKYPNHTLIHAELTDIPLANASAAQAYCFHVLMHLDAATLTGFFKEAARILPSHARLIIDIPSAPRRALSKRPPSGWHGDTAARIDEIATWTQDDWTIHRWRGIVFFPIHRMPSRIRPLFQTLDSWLGRTWLALYSSYYVIELERRG